jgi:hypothetical protein
MDGSLPTAPAVSHLSVQLSLRMRIHIFCHQTKTNHRS